MVDKNAASVAGDSRDVDGIKQLCNSLRDSGLMKGATIKSLWDSFDTRKPRNAEELGAELVRRKQLTSYQFERLKQHGAESLRIDQYTILDRIGAGGMGEVLKARHERMQRYVALKIISEKFMDSSEALERFEQETRAAAQLSHPNIVAAYDAGEKDGNYYLVLEYVDGQDLSTIVGRNGPLRVPIALDYIIQAAEGLQYSHRRGIVHRDMKPGNLLVDSTGVVKILDMGLAFMTQRTDAIAETSNQRLTQQGQVMGTSAYMAPEQAIDVRKADARSDIYSLGCTLYDLLIGHPPYEGETHMGVIVAHREMPIPSITAQRAEVPPAVDEVFRRMVAKKPEDRYASMGEVIAALRACVHSPAMVGAGATATFSPENAAPPPPRDWSADAVPSPQQEEKRDTFRSINSKQDTVVSRARGRRTKSLSKGAVIAGIAVLALLSLGGGALAILLSVKTPQGTLLIESDDPNVSVKVTKGGELVEIVDSENDWKVSLQEGEYQLELTGGNDRFDLNRNVVVVKRGKTERLRVTLEPKVAAADPVSAEPDPVPAAPQPQVQAPKQPKVETKPKPTKVASIPTRQSSGNSQPATTATKPVVDKLPKLELVHNLLGRRSPANDVRFSPDGKTLASCDRNGLVVMWNVDDGQFLRQYNVPFSAWEMAFSSDGKSLAFVGERLTVAICDAETGAVAHKLLEITAEEEQEYVKKHNLYPLMSCVAFSADGKRLYAGNNLRDVYVWDTSTGKQLTKIEVHDASVYGVACSPDGRWFATCSYDGTSQIWNAETFESVHKLKHERESTVFDLRFSADSKVLYTCGNNTDVVAWDVQTGDEIKAMRGHGSPVVGLSLSSDEKLLASWDSGGNSMRFWDVASGETLSVLRNGSPQPSGARFSPTDPTLFVTWYGSDALQLSRYNGEEADESGNVRTADDGTVTVHQEVADDHLVAPPWQSFKAPIAGTLDRVEFQPLMEEGFQGNLSIYEGEGIEVEPIYTQQYTIQRTDSSSWRSFTLTEPVPLEAGKTYTVELAGAIGMMHATTDRYGDGRGSTGWAPDMAFRFHMSPGGE